MLTVSLLQDSAALIMIRKVMAERNHQTQKALVAASSWKKKTEAVKTELNKCILLLKEAQSELTSSQSELASTRCELESSQSELKVAQSELEVSQPLVSLWRRL